MSEEILYIDDGGLVYYINENEFITCDEIPMPMLEGIKHLQQKVEQLENIRKEIKKEIKKYAYTDTFGDTVVLAKYIEDILNKGDNNGRK